MRHRIVNVISLAVIIIIILGCNNKKEDKFINEKSGKEEQIHIIRFDRELFATPNPNTEIFLKNLQKKYPEMFASTLDDRGYRQMIEKFIMDSYLLDAQNIVQRTYPDLTFLEKDLTTAFAKLKKQHSNTHLPKRVFSMIFGPAEFSYTFENRCYTNGEYSVIALDVYSYPAIEKNPYYSQMPKYMSPTLNQRYIAPDFMRMYLKNITYANTKDVQMNPDCTFLDYIIYEGKYTFITQNILSTYKENEILRYTENQLKWCKKNEKLIWGYIIENRLLYEKDRSKFMSLTAEGPSSKPLTDSPARVGNYIGYHIVQNFMDKVNISWDSLINITDSQVILQKSNYKPTK
ncbi:MAG: hypothetical protein ACTTJH_01760 [Bacteroidales bacterium]